LDFSSFFEAASGESSEESDDPEYNIDESDVSPSICADQLEYIDLLSQESKLQSDLEQLQSDDKITLDTTKTFLLHACSAYALHKYPAAL